MALLTPRFSASRAVSEYTERYYLPAASAYRERAGEKGRIAAEIVAWRHAMACKWSGIRLGELRSETRDQSHAFELQVHLNDLDPACVLVELFADTIMGHAAARQEMKRIGQAPGASAGDLYRAAVPADRSPTDYTVRVMPRFGGVAIPLEDRRILWQH
jgi:starch phosphorylase